MSTNPLMSRHEILSLYKQLLQQARIFPSITRRNVIEGIKLDFRDNKNLTDYNTLRIELARALDGLDQLKQYNRVHNQGVNLSIDLSKTQPLGPGRFDSRNTK